MKGKYWSEWFFFFIGKILDSIADGKNTLQISSIIYCWDILYRMFLFFGHWFFKIIFKFLHILFLNFNDMYLKYSSICLCQFSIADLYTKVRNKKRYFQAQKYYWEFFQIHIKLKIKAKLLCWWNSVSCSIIIALKTAKRCFFFLL